MIHFPDYLKDQLPEREFVFAIISTVRPGQLKQLIDAARSQRSVDKVDEKDDAIEITAEIKEAIMQVISQKVRPKS